MVSALRVPDRSPNNRHLDIRTVISIHEERKQRTEVRTAIAGAKEDDAEVQTGECPSGQFKEKKKHTKKNNSVRLCQRIKHLLLQV